MNYTPLARFGRRLVGAALGLLLVAAALPQPASAFAADESAPAGPALWVVKDQDSTIYLFGTVHVLRPETQWRRPEITAAFEAASELWLEVADVDDQAAAVPLVQKYGLSPDTPLLDRLETRDLNRLSLASHDLGVPMAALNPYQPWFAAVTLSMTPVAKAGYDPQSGVELILKAEADEAGKTVRGLETMEEQFQILSGMSDEAQLAFLSQTLEDYAGAVALLDGIVADWAEGDIEGIDEAVGAEMAREAPGVYRAMLADRNADWAEQIDAILDGSGTAFIAVGAGHLTGADSVQAYLAKRGIATERL